MIFFKKKHKNHYTKVYTTVNVKFTQHNSNISSIIIDNNWYSYDTVERVYEVEPINENITFKELISKSDGWPVKLPMTNGGYLEFKLQKISLNDAITLGGDIYYYTPDNEQKTCFFKDKNALKIYLKKNNQSLWYDVNVNDITIFSSDLENQLIISFTGIELTVGNNVVDDDYVPVEPDIPLNPLDL